MRQAMGKLQAIDTTSAFAAKIKALCHLKLARVLRMDGQFNDALYHYQAADDLAKQNQTPHIIIQASMGIGDIQHISGEVDGAKIYLKGFWGLVLGAFFTIPLTERGFTSVSAVLEFWSTR